MALRATQSNEDAVLPTWGGLQPAAAFRRLSGLVDESLSSTEVPMALRATQGYGDAVASVMKSTICGPSSTER